jgi:hypothetical protein
MGFLAQLQKVRVSRGEGTVNESLQYASKLTGADLPVTPSYGDAIEARKIAALHRELARVVQRRRTSDIFSVTVMPRRFVTG